MKRDTNKIPIQRKTSLQYKIITYINLFCVSERVQALCATDSNLPMHGEFVEGNIGCLPRVQEKE